MVQETPAPEDPTLMGPRRTGFVDGHVKSGANLSWEDSIMSHTMA